MNNCTIMIEGNFANYFIGINSQDRNNIFFQCILLESFTREKGKSKHQASVILLLVVFKAISNESHTFEGVILLTFEEL